MTAHFAVIGNPVAHSRSPAIHQLFAQQFGHQLHYHRQLATPGNVNAVVAKLFREGLAGANVTVPFKQRAYQLVTQKTPAAAQAGAVNTLVPTAAGGLLGANTDGMGLVYDMQRLGVSLAGANILLLGAGGAAQGVLADLCAQQPNSIWIANRSVDKVEQLAQTYSGCRAVKDWQAVERIDVVINATSASLFGQVPELPRNVAASASIAYDMVYADQPTAFMSYAEQCGIPVCVDGLGMLVGQAAESYRLWWGVERPDIESVMQALRDQP